ncbi:hypothetical protein MATL_G00188020 [Megalops atlanticus]|uniref:Leucine-rich repeat-containing protein 27 n=1 Tax=Megalops atlanticus TaxID=7932 RepID=A0A9D3PPP3_MEGAT|nr:hypothetical protein MATL_G00188020 [Megalops atlanticus]
MASLEEDIGDQRLNFERGDTSGKVMPPPFLHPDSASETHIPVEATSDSLCLSRRKLKHIPESILKISKIKNLYLEGNEISILPDALFSSLSNLVWLDLRNNQITMLPPEIGQHRFLKTLLLEGNPISELPLELGNLISLKALSLRRCPIMFPPQEVLHKGVQCILQFLRKAMAERPVSGRNNLTEVPPIEKLQLSSLACSEEVHDSEELQRFEELKLRMMQTESVDFGHGVPTPSLPPKSGPVRREGGLRGHTLPVIPRKVRSVKCKFPELPPCNMRYWKSLEERKLAAMKELKEKQAIIEQRRKDEEVLQEWRSEARVRQERRVQNHARRNREEVLRSAPYAIDPQSNMKDSTDSTTNSALQQEPRQMSLKSLKEMEEMRACREKDLEQQIRTHIQMMQDRNRRPKGSALEDIKATQQEVDDPIWA